MDFLAGVVVASVVNEAWYLLAALEVGDRVESEVSFVEAVRAVAGARAGEVKF